MNLLLIVISLLSVSLVANSYRNRLNQATRWRLYALRDRLRNAAFLDRAVRESPLFCEFDGAIGRTASNLGNPSIWMLLGALGDAGFRAQLINHGLERDERVKAHDVNGVFVRLRDDINRVVGDYFLKRHPVLLAAIALVILFRTRGKKTITPVLEEITYEANPGNDRPRPRTAYAA